MGDQSNLVAALRGTTRRLDNENAVLRAALARVVWEAERGITEADALDLNDAVIGTLATILEHGSHAWRTLGGGGDGPWPPDAPVPDSSAAYHVAAMLRYTKRLYDEVSATREER